MDNRELPKHNLTAVELAEVMLEYGRLSKQLDELREVIETTVLSMRKTQTVGDIRASYSGGRGSYDYQAALYGELDEETAAAIAVEHSTVIPSTTKYDYRAACKSAGVDTKGYYTSTRGPKVTVKTIK